MRQRAPSSSRFPYTTLFRSRRLVHQFAREVLRFTNDACLLHRLQQGALISASDDGKCIDLLILAEIRRLEEHTSELQSPYELVCRLLLEKKTLTIVAALLVL